MFQRIYKFSKTSRGVLYCAGKKTQDNYACLNFQKIKNFHGGSAINQFEQFQTNQGLDEQSFTLTPQHQSEEQESETNDWSFLKGANKKLYTAIDQQDIEGVNTALDEEADIQCSGDILWSTPLHLACERGQRDIVRMLLDRGAQWGATNSFGAAPLHLIAWADKWNEIVRELLQNGADVNQRTITAELQQAAIPNLTPLHLAVTYDAIQNVDTLLEFGADTNATDNSGSTVLHYAIQKNFESQQKQVTPLVQKLIKNNANPNIKNIAQKSPFFLSVSHGHEPLVDLFLKNGADLNEFDEKGRQALHLAVLKGNWRIVQKFLEKGVQCDVMDNEGNSPLMLAKKEALVKIKKILLEYGAKE